MILHENVLSELRTLAGEVSASDRLNPADLDLLASLAKDGAAYLREAAQHRKILAGRIELALNAFPDLASNGFKLSGEPDEHAISALEQLAAEASGAAERLRAAMEALGAASTKHDFDAVKRHAEEAKTAEAAFAAAKRQVTLWLDERGTTPPTTGELYSNAPPTFLPEGARTEAMPIPAGLPELGGGPSIALGGAEAIEAAPSSLAYTQADERVGSEISTALPREGTLPSAQGPETAAEAPTLGTRVGAESGKAAEAVWAALRSHRLGLAEALLEVGALGGEGPILSAAIQLTAMALVADGNGEVDDEAREATVHALDAWQRGGAGADVPLAAFTLLVPASATLALLAPGSDQTALLTVLSDAEGTGSLNRQLPGMSGLARAMATAPVASNVLVSARDIMAALVSEEEWTEEVARAANEISAWQAGQTNRRIRYAAATDVWRQMLRADGCLGAPLRAAIGGPSRAGEVRRFLEQVSISSAIRKTEEAVRGVMSARRAPIEGPAYRELEGAMREAERLLRSWLTLIERRPFRTGSDKTSPVAHLRDQLRLRIAKAKEELGQIEGSAAAALPVACMVLSRLLRLLEGQSPVPSATKPRELLGRDLLSLVEVPFDAGWDRQRPLPAGLHEQLEALANRVPVSLGECARWRIAVSDFVGADLAINAMGEVEEARALHRELHSALEQEKTVQIGEIDATRVEVEEADRAGRLDTGQSQELIERLQRVRELVEYASAVDAKTLFAESMSEIEIARDVLSARKRAARDRINLRLNGLGRALGAADRSSIHALLERGQFALAEDQVERLEAGEPLDTGQAISVEEAFEAFFPQRAERLAAWLRSRRAGMAELGSTGLGLPANLLPAGQSALASDLASLAAAWADCIRLRGNMLQNALVKLLSEFGFTDPELPDFTAPAKSVTEAQFLLRVRPLRDRATAVLPQFGSEANGTYTLICLWQKRDPEDISQALAASVAGIGPRLVLFFAPLDADQRRRLASLARADRLHSAIVIDETLALHLATLHAGRLPAVFACSVPFTDARPWTETGTPPPEMFFGRSRELRAVADTGGEFTHLIYGGRQLGKTAVLRQVERTEAGVPDTTARYVSIADIGLQHPPDELWQRLRDELMQAGVPMLAPTGGERARAFRASVGSWLDGKPTRRILLLLDEADEFFVKDRANGFQVTEALRTLSVERDRRFKPVFAGLKNVQKLARDPNTPLAHLGTPLVVGPLLRGEERQQAEALVRWPFAALGYRMDGPVVSRILAFANYYPSLVQVVCQRLLRILRQQQGGGGPPWQVRMEDVERVLDMPEVRTAAFERFRITLELDQRYNLLTLVAAEFSLDDPELLARGIDAPTLRALAAHAWPHGFPPELGDDAFEALLDEMVGLGLLRAVGSTHYALRSGNLAHLIGTHAEIRRQIEEFASRPAPPESDPLETRRVIGERRSLLTARQEGFLLARAGGAAILAGLQLANIGRWKESAEGACRAARHLKASCRILPGLLHSGGFQEALNRLEKRDSSGDLILYLVSPEAPWDGSWVEEALRRFTTTARTGPAKRVLFIADAKRAWSWAGDPRRRAALDNVAAEQRIVELTAGPWSRTDIDLWIANDRLGGMTTDAVLAVTGGWDMLLSALERLPERERRAGTPLNERLLREGPHGDALVDIATLPEALRILHALADLEELRQGTDVIDAKLVAEIAAADRREVEHALAWGELVGAVLRGQHGLVLQNEIRMAVRRLPAAVSV